jgi:hypothetical protein
MVSAGVVHQPASEASLGTVNDQLLAEATRITGGRVLKPGEVPELDAAEAAQFVELWPPIVVALLLLFLADIVIRRWENVQGLASATILRARESSPQ